MSRQFQESISRAAISDKETDPHVDSWPALSGENRETQLFACDSLPSSLWKDKALACCTSKEKVLIAIPSVLANRWFNSTSYIRLRWGEIFPYSLPTLWLSTNLTSFLLTTLLNSSLCLTRFFKSSRIWSASPSGF
jgi:hypothetical protein